MHRAAMHRDQMRRAGAGGGGGGGGGTGDGSQCFATIAALAAFDTAANPDVCIGFVETVQDFWIHDPAAAFTTDGITVIAATGGGQWIREDIASQHWIVASKTGAGVATWFINGTTGNDENSGVVAGAPLKTGAEFDRRTHGLLYQGGEVVTITVAAAPSDGQLPVRVDSYSPGQLEQLRIVGTRVVAATGSVTAATAQASGTNTQGNVTLSADVSAHIGKYIKFFSAGPAFRCSSWIAAGAGLGPYQLFTPTDENGGIPTAVVNPAVGNTYEVYDLPSFDINIGASTWASGINVINCQVANNGGFSHLDNDAQFLSLIGSKIAGALYDSNFNLTLEGSIMFPPAFAKGAFLFEAGGIFDPAGAAGGNASFGGTTSGLKTRVIFNRFNPIISGARLLLDNCTSVPNSTNGPAFFQSPGAGACITVDGATEFHTGLVWGSPATTRILEFLGQDNKVSFTTAPTITATQIKIDGCFANSASLPITGMKDTQNNEAWITTVGRCPGNAIKVDNQSSTSLTTGDLVCSNGTSGQVTSAKNTTPARSRIVGASQSIFPTDDGTLVLLVAGYAYVDHDAAPTAGAIAWVSETAFKATTTPPTGGVLQTCGVVETIAGTTRGLMRLVQIDIPQITSQRQSDDLIGGSAETGEIGSLGFSFSNFTVARIIAGTAANVGVIRFTSTAVAAQINSIQLASFNNVNTIRHDQWQEFTCTYIPLDVNADFDIRGGIFSNAATNPPTDGTYWERLAADANFFLVTRAGGVQTRINSGVAYATATSFEITARKRTGGNIDWYINGTLVGTSAANIPAAATGMMPVPMQTIPGAAAARATDWDSFDLVPTPSARPVQ